MKIKLSSIVTALIWMELAIFACYIIAIGFEQTIPHFLGLILSLMGTMFGVLSSLIEAKIKGKRVLILWIMAYIFLLISAYYLVSYIFMLFD